MTGGLLHSLANRRSWVYVGGLAGILAVRITPVERPVRVGVVALVLAVMVLTFVGERLGDAGVRRPVLLAAGLAGAAVGGTITLTGRIVGLPFLLGGLLFVGYALEPRGDQS